MDRPNFTFRQAQAAFDVITLAQRTDDTALLAIGGERLPIIVREQGCRFESEEDLEPLEAVSTMAVSPVHDESCTTALAIVLADALQDGLSHGSLGGYADTSFEAVMKAPRPLRAAIVRAFQAARNLGGLGVLPDELPFKPNDGVTSDPEPIRTALCHLARSMDSSTRDFVARADYGSDVEKHRDMLDDVLQRDDCRLRKGEHWHPSEVVELIAHVPSQPGFIECTALLIANAIPTKDEMGWFDFRLENIGETYFTLPLRGNAIVAGLRHLYESDEHFLSYHTRQYDPVLAPERMIPLVDFPPASS